MEERYEGSLDRRAFLKGIAAAGMTGIVAGAGLGLCSAAYAETKPADKTSSSATSSAASGSASGSGSAAASGSTSGSADGSNGAEVTDWVDAIASASVNTSKFTNYTADELDAAINSYTIECTVATVNEDGSPNVAIFTPGMFEKKYLGFGWGDNQTKRNFDRQKIGMICFDAPDLANADKTKRHNGAKVKAALVEDEAVIDKLHKDNSEFGDFVVVEIIDIAPIG